MANFNWNDLRFFLALTRSGKLQEAARIVGSDYTTVSRRIDALEEALDCKLFVRSNRGFALTSDGQRLLEEAAKIESLAIGIEGELSGGKALLAGPVRISAPDGFGSYFLAPRLHAFSARYPQVDIQLIAMPRNFSLPKREADIAISLNPPPQGRLHALRLTDYTLHLYGARDFLATRPAITKVDDLVGCKFIGYIEDMVFSPDLDYLRDIHAHIKSSFQSTNLVAQLKATEAGLGVCVLPNFMAVNNPNLVPVLRDKVRLKRTFWLLINSDMKGLARIKALRDFIVQQTRTARTLFLPD